MGEVFEKILFAADLRTIKLAAPIEKDRAREKSIVQSSGIDLPAGKLAMSESADAAMLEANGLKPTGTFEVYRIWWMPKRGVPIWAADFLVGDDGLAMVPVDLPTGREKGMALSVTLEDESYSESPNGPVALKGEMSPLPAAATGWAPAITAWRSPWRRTTTPSPTTRRPSARAGWALG